MINKDVTSEEIQRVEDLVRYLEGQNSETGLQKQVLEVVKLARTYCFHWLFNSWLTTDNYGDIIDFLYGMFTDEVYCE